MRKSYARVKNNRFIWFKMFIISVLVFLSGMMGVTLKTEQLSLVETGLIEAAFVKEETHSLAVDKPLVVIDPGHGGIDAGAVINEVNEKDLNLEISLKLKDVLEEAGYEVLMTRVDDEFIELADRAEIANEAGADLFISIHLNSYVADASVNGVEVYYNETTKSVADKNFAQAIQTTLSESTNAKDRGIRAYDELVVTRKTTMPACLVEMAFMSNATELELVQTDTYQQKIVSGILFGVQAFLER